MPRGLSDLQKKILVFGYARHKAHGIKSPEFASIYIQHDEPIESETRKLHGSTWNDSGKDIFTKTVPFDPPKKMDSAIEDLKTYQGKYRWAKLQIQGIPRMKEGKQHGFLDWWDMAALSSFPLGVLKGVLYPELYKVSNAGQGQRQGHRTKDKNKARVTITKSLNGLEKRGLIYRDYICNYLTTEGIKTAKELIAEDPESQKEVLREMKVNEEIIESIG